ncbi:hypothetical protein U27_05066 [Candidatus Vecturithrix granuli]|uniref:ArnT-like N-terminal domain-containing protein n=1 Tax=Vecturithrix granuli TaxID=1499967 RepID=A0A081C0I8_VECG1|nr:hypothetical protein U27_05066 [Candidatus Vecturithrix granuli]
MRRKQLLSLLLVFVVVVGLCGLRLVHLTADPPADLSWSGGLFFDEGAYTHNARNQILFGEWKLDDWNDFYYSPILTILKWGVFSVIGIGIAQERLVSIAFCGLTLWVLYLALRVTLRRSTAILSVILLGINYMYVMYSRLGLFEIPLIFFMVLTMFFWQLGLKHQHTSPRWHSHACMFLAGVSCFNVYIFKALAIYFLPVPLTGLVVLWFAAKDRLARKRLLTLAGTFLAGMILTVAVWYVAFFAPNYEAIHRIGAFVTMLSLPRSLTHFYREVCATPFFAIFLRTPVVLALSIAYLLYPLYVLLHQRSKLEPADVFLSLWFFAHFFFFLGYGYRPPRYYVPIIPPMCALAARGIVWTVQVRKLQIPYRISPVFWGLCWLIGSVLWTGVLIPGAYQYGAIPHFTVPHISGYSRMALSVFLAGGCTFLAFWLARRHQGGFIHLPHHILLIMAGLSLLISLNINGRQYARWALHPNYVVRNISRELGTMLDNAYLAGLATTMLCLENTHKALYVWHNFTNYQNTFQRFPVTHLFLAEFNDEVGYYRHSFPEVMKRATLLKTYWIKGSRFHLYSIIDPTIEQIIIEQSHYSQVDPVTVQLEVRNNDPRRAKEFEVGWLLYPMNSETPSMVKASVAIHLAPAEQQLITVSQQAPPGNYALLATFFPAQQELLEAETLPHQIGQNVEDLQASNNKARYTDAGRSGFLTYGPYRIYPAGAFTTEMSFKYSLSESIPNLSAVDSLAHVDISSHRGKTILVEKALSVRDFDAPNQYQTFRLSYRLETQEPLEFRVFTHGIVPFAVDHITTTFFRGVWWENPIIVSEQK